MKFMNVILFPFRIFVNNSKKYKLENNGDFKKNCNTDSKIHFGNSSNGGNVIDKVKSGSGWRFGKLFRNFIALIISLFLLMVLISFIESNPRYISQFGKTNISKITHLKFIDLEGKPRFYQDVLATAITSSDISIIQIVIIFFMIFLGFRMLFTWLGNLSLGNSVEKIKGSKIFMSMAIILLPALGMLSTVIGILSSGNISREETKLIIFGPSGIGIIGYLLATVLYHFAELLDRE